MVFGVKRKRDSSLSLVTYAAPFFQKFPAPRHSEKTTQFPKAPELGTLDFCLLRLHLLPYPVKNMPLDLMAFALSTGDGSLAQYHPDQSL